MPARPRRRSSARCSLPQSPICRLFEDARQALVYAAPHIGFAVSVDQDQFLSMAKIRALRKLWARVQDVCSIPPSVAAIHAETS